VVRYTPPYISSCYTQMVLIPPVLLCSQPYNLNSSLPLSSKNLITILTITKLKDSSQYKFDKLLIKTPYLASICVASVVISLRVVCSRVVNYKICIPTQMPILTIRHLSLQLMELFHSRLYSSFRWFKNWYVYFLGMWSYPYLSIFLGFFLPF